HMGQGSALKMEFRGANDHAIQFLKFVALHPDAIHKGSVDGAQIDDQPLAVLPDDLGVFFGNHGMGDHHVAARVASDHQMVAIQVDVLHLQHRLEAGAKDQRFAAVAAERDVIAVVQRGGFDADSVDESPIGGLVGQLDRALLDGKLRVYGGDGGVFHHHLAAHRIAAHHQSLVRYVLAFDRELVNDQVNVGAGHDVRNLD